jgi:hypothetical protein
MIYYNATGKKVAIHEEESEGQQREFYDEIALYEKVNRSSIPYTPSETAYYEPKLSASPLLSSALCRKCCIASTDGPGSAPPPVWILHSAPSRSHQMLHTMVPTM